MTGISLVDEVDGHLTRVTADPASDTLACYGAAGARGAWCRRPRPRRCLDGVPPDQVPAIGRSGRVKALGRRRGKKASGDHQHARVEHACFRYTSIVGDGLRARRSSGPRREAVLACHVLDRPVAATAS